MNTLKQCATYLLPCLLVLATFGTCNARCKSCPRQPQRQVVRRQPVKATARRAEPTFTQEVAKIEKEIVHDIEQIGGEVKKEVVGGGKVIAIHSEDELVKYIKGHNKVVVDVYASWCGPCKAFAPHYEKFAAKHPEITCLKVDGEKVPSVKSNYNITGYPTFVVYKNGTRIGKSSGAPVSAESFAKKLNAIAPGFVS